MLDKISLERKGIGHIFRPDVNFGKTKATTIGLFGKAYFQRIS
jgi:hypothetical protein